MFSAIWEPAYGKNSSHKFVKWAVANWQLSQITTLATGQPATTTMRIAGSPFAGAAFNTSLNGLGGTNRVPYLPFANMQLDNIYRTDARITKTLPFSERVKAYASFEAFNISNSQYNTGIINEAANFAVVNGVAGIRPSLGLNNGIASQGFPDGTNARRAQVSLRLVF